MADLAEAARRKKRAEETKAAGGPEAERAERATKIEENLAEHEREEREREKLREFASDPTAVAARQKEARSDVESKAANLSDEELDRWQPDTLGERSAKVREKARRRVLKSGASATDAAASLAARQGAK